MTDPYKVLNVSEDATDAQIKEAYRELAKKYHPDNYAGSPIADLASEKMKEINEAYDTIVNDRKRRKSGGYDSASSRGAAYSYAASTEYSDVRSLISSNRIADAV